ncbi:LysR substrate-binding domain-containing protein [Bradyrhizobium sp. RT11b]|uniref:LysR substrate-binding domain-containing protein n=1 Tax=Bradyrhizobium sp. RT11b TaxID=3156332 RepID=UPI0033996F9A
MFINAAHGEFDSKRREFDLAIEMTRGKFPGLHSEAFMDEYLTPVCSPEYLRRHDCLKRIQDLARCTLLHDGHPWTGAVQDAEWRHWLDHVGAKNVDSNHGQFFSLSSMSLEAALNHQGVALGLRSRTWLPAAASCLFLVGR